MNNYILEIPKKVPLERNFATNINPLGPPKWVFKYLKENSIDITSYPELWHQRCDEMVARILGVDSDCHITIPGTSEFFSQLPSLFNFNQDEVKNQKWAAFKPTFWEYSLVAKLNNIEFYEFPLDYKKPKDFFDIEKLISFIHQVKPNLFFLCSPNNPTGHALPLELINRLSDEFPNMIIILDLTYAYFEKNFYEYLSLINVNSKNIIAVISYSKFFCLPGLRIGSVIFPTADISEIYRKISGPLRLNIFSEKLLPLLLSDDDYINSTKSFFYNEWDFIIKTIKDENLEWYCPVNDSSCFRTFISKENHKSLNYSSFVAKSLYDSWGIRVCDGKFYGLEDAIRIRAGTRDANLKLIEALKNLKSLN